MNISGALGGIMGRSPEGRPDRNRSPRLGSPRGTSTSRDSTLDPNQAATVGHISEIMNEIRGLKGILEPISQNVKKVETDLTKVKSDLHHHVEAAKVDSSNIHEQLGKLDAQIKALETKQKEDLDEMRQLIAGGTAATRAASLPPVTGRIAANDLSKYDRNQAEIDAVKTKLEIHFTAVQIDEANAENAMHELLRQANCNVPLQIMKVQKSNNGVGSRVQVAFVDVPTRDVLRNALRKKVDGKWTNTVPAVECYTIDPGFIFRRNQPMLDARKLLAGPLGVKPTEIKFDKIARKLISPDGNTILATQSLSTWRVTIVES